MVEKCHSPSSAMDEWYANWVRRHHEDLDSMVDNSESLSAITQKALSRRQELAKQLALDSMRHAAKLGESSVTIPHQVLKDLGLLDLSVWLVADIGIDNVSLHGFKMYSPHLAIELVWGEEAVKKACEKLEERKKQRDAKKKADEEVALLMEQGVKRIIMGGIGITVAIIVYRFL
jgi:hypothetical protein